MKRFCKEFLRKSQITLAIALGTVPIPALLFAYVAAELLPYVWVFPAAYLLLTMISFAVPEKLRIVYGIIGALLLTLICTALLPGPLHVRTMVFWIGVFFGIVLLLSLKKLAWGHVDEIPLVCVYLCSGLYFLSFFLILMDDSRAEVLSLIEPWLTAALLAFVCLVMLSLNRDSLTVAAGKRQNISGSMRRKHTLLTLALFAVALLFALIPSTLNVIIDISAWLSALLGKLKDLLYVKVELPAPSEVTTAPTEETGLPLVPTKWADPEVAQIVFIVMVVLAVIVLVPLVIYAVIIIVKALRRGARRLWKWWVDISPSAVEEYYEDEVTDTRKSKEREQLRRERRQRSRSVFANERTMTPVQRIRYRYQRLAQKHPEWRAGSTARENLPVQAAALYERARYSEHPVTEEEAALFKSDTKRV